MIHLSYASQLTDPIEPENAGVRRFFAWLVILGCSAFVAVRVYQSYHRPARDVTDVAATHSVQLQISARYMIGARELLKKLSPASVQTLQNTIDELNQLATTSVDKVRLATVVAEISGVEPANKRLDALSANLNDPGLLHDVRTLKQLYASSGASISQAERARLIARHGLFGRLAAAYGAPEDHPDRKKLAAEGLRTFAALWGFVVALVVAGLTGFILLILAMIRLADGKVVRAYAPPAGPRLPFLEGFAWWLAAYLLISFVAHKVSPNVFDHAWIYLLAMLVPPALGIAWPRVCGVDSARWRAGLGWHAGRGVFREIGCGLAGYVIGLPIMAGGFVIMLLLNRFAHANPTHPIIEEMAGSTRQLAAAFVLACIYAPIVEETMFRGTLFHYLRGRHGWLVSASVTSFLFAAIHPQGWTVVPVLFSIAFVFAAIREWRGSILCSAAAHALNNGTMLTLFVLMVK